MAAFPYRILVEWSGDDEAFVARVPAVGVASHGESPEAATHEAMNATGLMLESLRAHKRPIPESDVSADYAGRIALRLSPSLHARVARAAAVDEQSLNTYLVGLIAEGLGRRSA